MEKICVFGHDIYKNTDLEITAEKNGRYINLKKHNDNKKEFRYDLVNEEFERINHYKTKEDKITPVKVKNITGWFTDCSIFCSDEKFAKLMIANKYNYDNNSFSNGVRFIEALNTKPSKIYEAWLSLGVEIDEIKTAIDNNFKFGSWRIDVHPQDLQKDVLKYIVDNHDSISMATLNHYKRIKNFNVLNELIKVGTRPQYIDIFNVDAIINRRARFGYRTEHVTHNILETDASDKAKRLRSGITNCIYDYNLNIESFCDFLLRVYHTEGLTIDDLFGGNHYPDYLRMEKVLKKGRMSKIDKYPRNFLTQFHITKKEYAVMKKEYDNEMFQKQCDKFRYLESIYDKYQIIVPNEIKDIENEADELKHCVRSYIQYVIDGKTLIVFLRDNESPSQPLVTIEVKNGYVTQAYGKQDSKPKNDVLDVIRLWAHENNLSLMWSWD